MLTCRQRENTMNLPYGHLKKLREKSCKLLAFLISQNSASCRPWLLVEFWKSEWVSALKFPTVNTSHYKRYQYSDGSGIGRRLPICRTVETNMNDWKVFWGAVWDLFLKIAFPQQNECPFLQTETKETTSDAEKEQDQIQSLAATGHREQEWVRATAKKQLTSYRLNIGSLLHRSYGKSNDRVPCFESKSQLRRSSSTPPASSRYHFAITQKQLGRGHLLALTEPVLSDWIFIWRLDAWKRWKSKSMWKTLHISANSKRYECVRVDVMFEKSKTSKYE